MRAITGGAEDPPAFVSADGMTRARLEGDEVELSRLAATRGAARLGASPCCGTRSARTDGAFKAAAPWAPRGSGGLMGTEADDCAGLGAAAGEACCALDGAGGRGCPDRG